MLFVSRQRRGIAPMPRKEFSRKTKRSALDRSGHRCEASGQRYGFQEGQRCNCHLSLGVQFDHVLPCELGGDNDLANCAAICVQCHKYATRNDVRRIRKSDRQRDRNTGVIRSKGSIQSAGFAKPGKVRSPKRVPPPRPLYAEKETNP